MSPNRMSQSGSDNGDFVVSVKHDNECHHFAIEVSEFDKDLIVVFKVALMTHRSNRCFVLTHDNSTK